MLLFFKIIFWLSVGSLVHTYIFYPLLLKILSIGKQPNQLLFTKTADYPFVSILMSVYNEEKVIREKLDSLCQLNYPKDKLRIYIGSDCSNDATNPIIEDFCKKNKHIIFHPYVKRRGKPGVINELAAEAIQHKKASAQHVFLLTDASVILEKDTLAHLVKHYKNDKIALVDANMVNVGMIQKGISKSENQYITGEVQLKHREGIVWGKMIGPFGGCYAIRSDFFHPVPPKFLVDDFYIAFRALEQGKDAINELEAICYESISHEITEEFRRKARISAGNFQNLVTFRHLLNPFTNLGFAFLSHKVLRWLGPFFILASLIASGILALYGNLFYTLVFSLELIWLIFIPLLDYFFKRMKIDIFLLRNIRYFNMMNVALLKGFLNFINGIKSNIWEPPKRM